MSRKIPPLSAYEKRAGAIVVLMFLIAVASLIFWELAQFLLFHIDLNQAP